MEKDIKLGNVGDLDISISGGKAKVEIGVKVDAAAMEAGAFVSVDAASLVDKLFAAIEKASPAGAVPIEESVKALVKAAVAAL